MDEVRTNDLKFAEYLLTTGLILKRIFRDEADRTTWLFSFELEPCDGDFSVQARMPCPRCGSIWGTYFRGPNYEDGWCEPCGANFPYIHTRYERLLLGWTDDRIPHPPDDDRAHLLLNGGR